MLPLAEVYWVFKAPGLEAFFWHGADESEVGYFACDPSSVWGGLYFGDHHGESGYAFASWVGWLVSGCDQFSGDDHPAKVGMGATCLSGVSCMARMARCEQTGQRLWPMPSGWWFQR